MPRVKWLRHPSLSHAEMAVVELRRPTGLYYKVGLLVNENRNPARPRGGKVPARPWGLELYLPLTSGQDRVQKFPTESAARERMDKIINDFVNAFLESNDE